MSFISSGSPRVRPMGVHRTCGEPNEIELTPIGVDLNGSGHVPRRLHLGYQVIARGQGTEVCTHAAPHTGWVRLDGQHKRLRERACRQHRSMCEGLGLPGLAGPCRALPGLAGPRCSAVRGKCIPVGATRPCGPTLARDKDRQPHASDKVHQPYARGRAHSRAESRAGTRASRQGALTCGVAGRDTGE